MTSDSPFSYKEGQPVRLKIIAQTELGYKAIINGEDEGLLYANEVFRSLRAGQEIDGYIKKIREDGKIDLSLYKEGHQAGEDVAPRILEMLEDLGGFLAVNEKTPPEEIYRLFGVSKKKFKIAIGGLYKRRLILIEEAGLRLVSKR
jgi:predicted RNA-binding protein (virulence factor B family)